MCPSLTTWRLFPSGDPLGNNPIGRIARISQDNSRHTRIKLAQYYEIQFLLPPDLFARIFKWIDMHHPAENNGVIDSAGFGAGFFRDDRALQSELGKVSMRALVL